MRLEESNIFFYPETWSKDRKRGLMKFAYIPTIFTFVLVGCFFYFIEKTTKGNLVNSAILALIAMVIMFLIRSSTWIWKEYMYQRHINQIQQGSKRHMIISILNMIRIIAIVVLYCFVALYGLGFIKLNWAEVLNIF